MVWTVSRDTQCPPTVYRTTLRIPGSSSSKILLLSMSKVIEPGSFIKARGINDECVVVLPVAYRESVIPGVRRSFHVHLLGKFSSVHPDFTPHPLLLIINQDAVRRRAEQRASAHADGVSLKVARKPDGITVNKGIVRGRKLFPRLDLGHQVGVPLFEYRLACGRHRGYRTEREVLRSHPGSGEVTLWSRSRWIRHLRNSVGDETRRQRPA